MVFLPRESRSMKRQKVNRQPELFQGESAVDPCLADESPYETLPSVWHGSDAELLEKMLDFYPRKRPKLILDATVNGGRFWEGSPRRVIGLDIDPAHRPEVVADNRRMPFRDQCF